MELLQNNELVNKIAGTIIQEVYDDSVESEIVEFIEFIETIDNEAIKSRFAEFKNVKPRDTMNAFLIIYLGVSGGMQRIVDSAAIMKLINDTTMSICNKEAAEIDTQENIDRCADYLLYFCSLIQSAVASVMKKKMSGELTF